MISHKKWDVYVSPNNLTLQERKDIMVILLFLNVFDSYDLAMENIKKYWINTVYPLPVTSDKRYNSTKQSRHLALKRIKKVYGDYVVYNF